MRNDEASIPATTNGTTPPGIIMRAQRRVFTVEFKRHILKRFKAGESISQLSRAVKVNEASLRRITNSGKKGQKKLSNKNKRYTEIHKREAVRRLLAGEKRQAVAKDMRISPDSLTHWKQQYAHEFQPKTPAPKREPGPMAAPSHVRDAISFLRHAKTEAYASVTRGDIRELDQAHMLAILALNELLKGR